ncbi:MAG TPA: hypothetical protein PLK86_06480, partial [Bacilli bacterium]|nr:hypothetical protein [Bacilli bacterium]
AVHALSAKENHPLIKEIKPWLNWALTESALVKDIINNKNAGKNLTEKLQEKYRLGSECLDYLLKKKNLLTEEEYQQSVKTKRGNLWWRVWEDKR